MSGLTSAQRRELESRLGQDLDKLAASLKNVEKSWKRYVRDLESERQKLESRLK